MLKLCSLNIPTKSIEEINKLPWEELPTELNYINTLTVPNINKILSNITQFGNLSTKYCDGSNKIRSCGTVHAYSGILTMAYTSHTPELQPLKDIYKTVKQLSETPIQFLREYHE